MGQTKLARAGNMWYAWVVMNAAYSLSRGRASLPALCRRKRTTPITDKGTVVAFIVPRERMAALLEEMEILANPKAMNAIRRAQAGKAKDHPLSILDED
jgi:hypothetical protein